MVILTYVFHYYLPLLKGGGIRPPLSCNSDLSFYSSCSCYHLLLFLSFIFLLIDHNFLVVDQLISLCVVVVVVVVVC